MTPETGKFVPPWGVEGWLFQETSYLLTIAAVQRS